MTGQIHWSEAIPSSEAGAGQQADLSVIVSTKFWQVSRFCGPAAALCNLNVTLYCTLMHGPPPKVSALP